MSQVLALEFNQTLVNMPTEPSLVRAGFTVNCKLLYLSLVGFVETLIGGGLGVEFFNRRIESND